MPEFDTTSGWASHPIARAGYILAMLDEERPPIGFELLHPRVDGVFYWRVGNENGVTRGASEAATDMALSAVRQYPVSRFRAWWQWLMSLPVQMDDVRGCTCTPNWNGAGISIPDPQCPVHSNLYGEGR